MRYLIPLLLICLTVAVARSSDGTIRDLADLRRMTEENIAAPSNFAVTATVVSPNEADISTLTLTDGTNDCLIRLQGPGRKTLCRLGDRVTVRGHTYLSPLSGHRFADADHVEIQGHGPPPEPVDATAEEILAWAFPRHLVRVTGSVLDVFRDEIDPRYAFLALASGRETLYLAIRLPSDESLIRLVGASIRATGLCSERHDRDLSNRPRLAGTVTLRGLSDIEILTPAPTDPFAVPRLQGTVRDIKNQAASPSRRRKTAGRVLATWQDVNLLIESDDGDVSRLELAEPSLPHVGDTIEAVGIPETDLYHLNLSRAIWRPAPAGRVPPRKPKAVSADHLLTDSRGNVKYEITYHGKPIRLTGVVQTLPSAGDGIGRFNLACDGHLVPVDFSSTPAARDAVEPGCTAEVTGICVMETTNWRPQDPFPRIRGLTLVIRSPADIRILRAAPWWTTRRLTAVIAVLLLALLGIHLRGRILRRLADTKLRERMRLAVELHDAVSQNLTAVALEVNAADMLAAEDIGEARGHLHLAAKTLRSCREELRNCLWDLRNNPLEVSDMNEAVRQTLRPQIGDARLAVRFNVPRHLLSDNTTHTVLHIVRELAVNAVRHGGATSVRVAGSVEDGALRFSVRDDGSGFDPASAPGVGEGHFGLQGIRERIREFAGALTVNSAVGAGTRVSVTMSLLKKEKANP